MEYRLRWADLGPHVHAALGESPTRRVIVVNTRDVPGDPVLSMLVRQGVDIALQTNYGRGLARDAERVVSELAVLITPQRSPVLDIDQEFARIVSDL